MKKILIPLLFAAAVATPAFAAEEEVVFNFLDRTSFGQCTQTSIKYDHDGIDAWTYSSYSSYVTMSNYNISANYYDDYLISPDLALEAGCEYVIYCKPTLYSQSDVDNANIDVLYGQGDNVETYTTLKVIKNVPYENYTEPAPTHEITFSVPESGNYRVAFRGYPSRLYLKDKTCVCSRGASAVPMPAQDFTVTPDPDGELKVDVSFTMPSATLTGQALTAPAYNLYRGVQKIKSGVEAAPGEKVSYSEAAAMEGDLIYAVEIVCGDEISEKLQIKTYVGAETPQAPADLALTSADGKFVISWTAPETGKHGVALVPEKLSYTVTRILDGVSTVVATDIAECSFSEAIEPVGLQNLSYSVTAKYGQKAKVSDPAECAPLRIGVLALPFADSFAGAEFNPLWDNTAVTQASTFSYLWKAAASATSQPKAEPYDGDGGLCIYNSYNIQRNNSARLSTPPLKYAEGDKPVISFAMYHHTSGTDRLKIQVSCDYGEWTDVPEGQFTPQGEPAGAWTVYNVDLSAAIAAGTASYRVGLLGESEYKFDIVIDDVRIFNLVDKDLELTSLAVAEEINAGNDLEITVKINNNGSQDVAADAYSVKIISDFPEDIDLGELIAVPSLGSITYTAVVPVHSLHARNATEYTFSAEIEFAGDEVPANNICEPTALTVNYSAGVSATELTGVKADDGSIVLSWTPAKDLGYNPVNIAESFEDEAFADDSTGPFNGWTIIDLDGRDGGNWYTASGSIFNLAKNAGTPGGKDGNNVLGVTVGANVQQDDWIISPLISCKDGSSMDISFLFGMKKVSSYGNNYYIELLYTTDESYDILNPQNNFTHTVGTKFSSTSASDYKYPQDDKMREVTFTGIPAEARYVALHFTTKGSYTPAMWVDNIRLTEVDESPLLGYHVYDVDGGGRLNEEMLDANATSYVIPAGPSLFAASRQVFVSAVYPDGEAKPSNDVDINYISGIEDVSADADTDARFYNLNGIEVKAGSLAPGIYIRRSAKSATKVLIR